MILEQVRTPSFGMSQCISRWVLLLSMILCGLLMLQFIVDTTHWYNRVLHRGDYPSDKVNVSDVSAPVSVMALHRLQRAVHESMNSSLPPSQDVLRVTSVELHNLNPTSIGLKYISLHTTAYATEIVRLAAEAFTLNTDKYAKQVDSLRLESENCTRQVEALKLESENCTRQVEALKLDSENCAQKQVQGCVTEIPVDNPFLKFQPYPTDVAITSDCGFPSPSEHEWMVIQLTSSGLCLTTSGGFQSRNDDVLSLLYAGYNLMRHEIKDGLQLAIYTGDRPRYHPPPNIPQSIPVFSTSNTKTDAILRGFPDFTFVKFSEIGVSDFDELVQEIQHSNSQPWQQDILFWAGHRNSNPHRIRLQEMAKVSLNLRCAAFVSLKIVLTLLCVSHRNIRLISWQWRSPSRTMCVTLTGFSGSPITGTLVSYTRLTYPCTGVC
jgi:Glycosyl transferase family 90